MCPFYDYLKEQKRLNLHGDEIIGISGDRYLPLISALLELRQEQPEILDGMIEVLPADDQELQIWETRRFRPPYMRALKDIGSFLKANGYEDASRFLMTGVDI
jgi:hypothetical protein